MQSQFDTILPKRHFNTLQLQYLYTEPVAAAAKQANQRTSDNSANNTMTTL